MNRGRGPVEPGAARRPRTAVGLGLLVLFVMCLVVSGCGTGGIAVKSRRPMMSSGWLASKAARNVGISLGSCCPSVSRVTTASAPCSMAYRNPVRNAAPLPALGC